MELAAERIHQFRTNELLNHFREMTTLIGMRPLFHPSIEEVTVEGILHALSDPVRVAMYADIVAQDCPQSCSNFLKVSDKAIPKSTLSQHFKILREAGLIRSERHGVEVTERVALHGAGAAISGLDTCDRNGTRHPVGR